MRIVALHPLYEFDAHATGEIRIFPVRFLPSSPAGIAKDIDVRRPEVQAFENIAMPIPHRLDMLDSRFGADHNGHSMDRIGVERVVAQEWDRPVQIAHMCGGAGSDRVERSTPI